MDTKKQFPNVLFIIIAILLLIGIIGASKNGLDIIRLNKMNNDIKLLEERIKLYYLDNGNLPITDKKIDNFSFSINPNDNDSYFEIDLSKLEDLNIELGRKTSGEDDIYIINEESMTVYYLKGVKYQNKEFHTRNINYEMIKLEDFN